MKFWHVWGVVFLLVGHAPSVMASPTSNEFIPCHQMASEVLLACLNDNAGKTGGKCWDAARQNNETCYERIFASHRPDKERIEAEKRVVEQNRKRRKNSSPD